MRFLDVLPFLEIHHRCVVSTKQRNGATQSSIVVSGAYHGKAAFVSVYPNSQKIRNLEHDSSCTLLVVTDDWHGYVVVQGAASLFNYATTPADEMRTMFREVYMACSDTPHPNWDEFDTAMVNQKAVVVLVTPDKVYGLMR